MLLNLQFQLTLLKFKNYILWVCTFQNKSITHILVYLKKGIVHLNQKTKQSWVFIH